MPRSAAGGSPGSWPTPASGRRPRGSAPAPAGRAPGAPPPAPPRPGAQADEGTTVDELGRDLGGLDARCTLAVLDQPGAYLLSHARLAGGAEYLAREDDLLARYRRDGFPDVVVLDMYKRQQHSELLDLVRKPPYREVAHRDFYSVYRRGARC